MGLKMLPEAIEKRIKDNVRWGTASRNEVEAKRGPGGRATHDAVAAWPRGNAQRCTWIEDTAAQVISGGTHAAHRQVGGKRSAMVVQPRWKGTMCA